MLDTDLIWLHKSWFVSRSIFRNEELCLSPLLLIFDLIPQRFLERDDTLESSVGKSN
jgi:hypothetical protein